MFSHSRRGPTIGILTDSILNEYQNTVLFGANDELRERGATVLLFAGGVVQSRDRLSAERNAIYDLVVPGDTDGLIVMAPIGNEIGVAALAGYVRASGPFQLAIFPWRLPIVRALSSTMRTACGSSSSISSTITASVGWPSFAVR